MCNEERIIEILCPTCGRCFLTHVVWNLRTGYLEGHCDMCNGRKATVIEARSVPTPQKPNYRGRMRDN